MGQHPDTVTVQLERREADMLASITGSMADQWSKSAKAPRYSKEREIRETAANALRSVSVKIAIAAHNGASPRPAIAAEEETAVAAPAKKKRRRMSPAARKRIADATRKRWAKFRQAKAAAEATTEGKKKGKPGKALQKAA